MPGEPGSIGGGVLRVLLDVRYWGGGEGFDVGVDWAGWGFHLGRQRKRGRSDG